MGFGLSIQKAVLDALKNDPIVSSLVVDIYDDVPQSQKDDEYPYIVVGEEVLTAWDTDTETGNDAVITVHVWSRYRGRKETKEIQAACYNVLHRSNIPVDGYSVVTIDNESTESFVDSDGLTRHGTQTFRFLLDEQAAIDWNGDFVLVYNTELNPIDNLQALIPLANSANALDCVVDWGDGNQETFIGTASAISHNYATAGSYLIRISGTFESVFYDERPEALGLVDILNWGVDPFLYFIDAFAGCSNLIGSFSDVPIIQVGTIQRAFKNCSSFIGDLSDFDVSGVQFFNNCFQGCTSMNFDFSNWDLTRATSLFAMFQTCISFEGKGLENWDVSSSNNFSNCFSGCGKLSADLSSWDISAANTVNAMFPNCYSLNFSMVNWNFENVTEIGNFLGNCFSFSKENYSELLISLSNQSIQGGLSLSTSSYYDIGSAQAARDILTNAPNLWTITDRGGV